MKKEIHILLAVVFISAICTAIWSLVSPGAMESNDKIATSELEIVNRIENTNEALDRWKERLRPNLPASANSEKDILEAIEEIENMDRVFVAKLQEENEYLKSQIVKLYGIIDSQTDQKSGGSLPVIAIIVSIFAMLPSWIALYRKSNA